MSGEPIRVLLADDHTATRLSIRDALESDGRFTVCAEASDAPAAVQEAARTRPALCVLDIAMPGRGTAAAWEISAQLPDTRIVMLTASRDDDDLFASLRAGASAYLLKDTPEEELPEALMRVVRGEAPIPPALVARMVEQFRAPRSHRRTVSALSTAQPLSRREWDILHLMNQGQTTRDIAQRLTLSQSAVRTHIASILKKLRVPDRDAALRLLREQSSAGPSAGD